MQTCCRHLDVLLQALHALGARQPAANGDAPMERDPQFGVQTCSGIHQGGKPPARLFLTGPDIAGVAAGRGSEGSPPGISTFGAGQERETDGFPTLTDYGQPSLLPSQKTSPPTVTDVGKILKPTNIESFVQLIVFWIGCQNSAIRAVAYSTGTGRNQNCSVGDGSFYTQETRIFS